MRLSLDAAAATHTGRRSQNEDSHAVDLRHGLFLVADGMGGYEGGEVASSLAAGTMLDFVARDARDPEGTWPIPAQAGRSYGESLLAAAVRAAHLEIFQRRGAEGEPLSQMGSTVAALLCRGSAAALAHVGDSRVYRLRGGALSQLTADHSLQAELAAQGLAWPHRNVITRALGIPSNHTPDVARLDLAVGDVYLLCSDGLYEVTPEPVLAELLGGPGGAAAAARALVEEAVRRGAHDNVTAVVVRVQPGSSSPSTSP